MLFVGGQVLGDDDEAVRVDDCQLLAAELDDAALLPSREGARDGVPCGAGHLCDVLPGDRKIDKDAAFDAAAGLRHAAGAGLGVAPLDLAGTPIAQEGVGVLSSDATG